MSVSAPAPRPSARTKLLDAALSTVRARGYAATTVDELCARAGVTKGAFFHHFRSKEALAVAAAEHWSATTGAVFDAAPYRKHSDPRDRLLGYVDFRKAILQGEIWEFTCLVGTMVQEIHDSSAAIRDACERSISAHIADIARDIAEARTLYAPDADWTAESLALHTQAVIQGAFILAKARNGPASAADSLDHLRRYIELLLAAPQKF